MEDVEEHFTLAKIKNRKEISAMANLRKEVTLPF
jgi:hypothetical protein